MAKKKIDDPSFLEFINLPLLKFEDDSEYHISGAYIRPYVPEPKYKAFFKGCLEKLLIEGNLPPRQVGQLKLIIEDFDNYNDDSLEPIKWAWLQIISIVKNLIEQPSFQEEYTLDISGGIVKIGWNLRPILHWKNNGFKIDLMPDPLINSQESHINPPKTRELAIYLAQDFIHFLTDHYKPGIFGYCKLDGCNRIIITTNGRKYCCPYHSQKVCREAAKKDLEKKEYARIRDKLRQRYNRHPHKHTMNREDFIRDNWDKDKLHLYRLPRSPK